MAKAVSGTLQISNAVIADLAGCAALMCYGVVGMAYTDDQQNLETLLTMRQIRKGIDVEMDGSHVDVTLHVVVDAGVNMRSVCENLESSVKFMLDQVAQIKDSDVHVVIESMRVR